MTKTAWVFPGQGSQVVGMGADLAELPLGKSLFERAEKILGWSVLDVCGGDEAKLSRTLYTQGCLYTIECIISDLLKEKGCLPQLVAGHSLGEYVALYTAGVFDFETGLALVKRRAELMDEASGGKMAALMKFDRQKLESIVEKTDGVVLANDNSEQQVVISGIPEAVDLVVNEIKAKKAVTLKVSGAFHSHLMEKAATEFRAILDSVEFKDAEVPVLSNVEPIPTKNAAQLKDMIRRQMTSSVRWREIMLILPKEEITQVVEVGPGKVLTGLLKRACPNLALKNVGTVADLSAMEGVKVEKVLSNEC